MKCKHCNGDGFIVEVNHGYADKYMCDHCLGTGIIEPLTSEEYIRSCSFEELAGAIYEWYSAGYTTGRVGLPLNSITEIVEWLKQPHTKN